ncbi:MAG: hypothetical protein KBF80_09885 [Flavobacteriales bacterium]|nr:hypothetical protein [Flavobacteriales bacterium]
MRIPTAFLACTTSLLLAAQGRESTMKTDTGTVVLHWFTTGQLSSKAWMDANDRWGHTWAYDRSGQVIFHRQTRKIAGHASVSFRYHPNGAVSRAEVSDAPDGGIQWYKSTTSFDPDGKQTGFSEEGWDNEGPIHPGIVKPQRPVIKPGTVYGAVREQRLSTNEYFVVARKNCRVQLRPKQTSPGAKDIDATLLKGDTLRGGTYSLGERFDPPLEQVAVTATNRRGKPKYKVLRVDSVQVSAEQRRWYLIVGR